MTGRLTIAALLASGLALLPAAAPEAQPVRASVVNTNGETLALETDKGVLLRLERPVSDIFITNPGVADVQVKSPRLLYIYGRGQGETTLYALGENEQPVYSATITVTPNLSRLTNAYEQLMPETAVNVAMVDGMAVLSGVAPTAAAAEAAERYARAYLKTDVVNQMSIVQPSQVNLRVKFAEVGRSTLKQLGFNWESAFASGDVLFGLVTGRDVVELITDPVLKTPVQRFATGDATDNFVGSITSGNFDVNFLIDALENEGLVSILAEPNLTAVSGQTATFLAGGEFPVPIPDEEGIAIEFREFGVRLAFTPIVQSADTISLRVAPEVSELTSAGAITIEGISVPALNTRRVETTVELGSGQSFAIAGLLQNNLRQDVRKFPGLGDIPILGALFRSDAFRSEETELVVIVTPYLVRPTDAKRLALPQDGLRVPSDVERYLHGETIKYAPRTQPAPGSDNAGPTLVGRAGFKLK